MIYITFVIYIYFFVQASFLFLYRNLGSSKFCNVIYKKAIDYKNERWNNLLVRLQNQNYIFTDKKCNVTTF